jgi:replicative DNA helicase
LGGFEPNNLYVIAGRPSMGKTALALNLSVRMSETVPILYFSLETGEFDLCVRMLTQISRARSWSMKTGHIGTDQWQHLIHDAGNLYKSNLIIDDSAKLTVMNLTTKIQHIINQYHVKGIVIDYLGLMTADSAETRSLEIGNITRQLKIIAKEYEVFIILLSQLNRLVESRPDKIPTLSDLRESGSVEQDADAVLFVYRPEYYDIKTVNNHTTENYAEIIIAKNRITGITGVVPMTYIKQHTRYENYTEEVNYREVRPKPPEATIFDTPF